MFKRLALAAAFVCGSAHAEFYTGNDLHERLNGDLIPKSVALGFIGGVSDALHGIILCPPDYATVGQARDIVVAYLQANPQTRHRAASELVADALSKAWPCRRNK